MGKKGGGLGSTLVLALVIVVLGVALGVGLARFGSSLPIVGSLLGEKPPRTTTGPVVVEGIQELDQLATVRWTESVKEMSGSGIQAYVEAGSGEVLLGMIKRIDESAGRFPLGTPQNFEALA